MKQQRVIEQQKAMPALTLPSSAHQASQNWNNQFAFQELSQRTAQKTRDRVRATRDYD